MTAKNPKIWSPILAGCCATLLGIGLQRFAYGPILPAMVEEGWLAAAPAGMLGAANLAGYLVGAFTAGMVARAFGVVWALRLSMIAAVIGFALCAIDGGFFWFLPWRILAGLTGGVLMVLAGPSVQSVVAPEKRNLASGLVITGVGLGIIVSSLLVPAILPLGLTATWLALALVALFLTLLTWRIWPDVPAPKPATRSGPPLPNGGRMMLTIYGFAGFAGTAHMVFWPDFVARGLGLGTEAGAFSWLVYGVAAALGGVIFSRLADWFGAGHAITFALAIQAASLILPLLWTSPLALGISGAGAGVTVLGITALGLVRSRELGGDGASRLWRLATAIWGVTTAVAGFLLSALLAMTDSHLPMFVVGLTAALIALALACWPKGQRFSVSNSG
ncbi:MAG: YbfB/YjiJ family MFS transporter [Geminicoccales bacterium]